MKILIDSTSYKQDKSLSKSDFSLLKDLGKKRIIELNIPWIVYKECITSSIQESQLDFNQAINKLLGLDKKGIHSSQYNEIRKNINKLNNLKIDFEDSTIKLWEEFINESNAILHSFNPNHSIAVFESYFTGSEPFKSLKNRDDIPDAFIYMIIKEISSKNKIILISNDNNIVSTCENDSNIVIFKTLKEFYTSKEFEPLQKKYNNLLTSEKYEEAINFVLENHKNIEDAALDFGNSLSNVEFEDPKLKSENNEGTIIGFSVEKVRLKNEEAQQIANQIFIPIEIHGYALIDYFIFKADYWCHPDHPQIADDWNDHYYRIEDEVNLTLTVILNLDIDQILQIKNSGEELELQINSFDSLQLNN
ncbi:PIN domain-containing protein [Chryseobacterium rhizosphaerae]|uniref:DUF4935 domain-containing protein n=1 Tax=Chryseobacterium rhizosphaerae TaxID=395937 RepID=A0ABX9IRB1_9FLAO|nr:PIN domain-containing protein [Chryseobacterium rhizosphaerae]REC78974.1 hypothetical protein DRF57_01480 [Chryseobacterium rhizosphaerae]GEN68063.1 hypothetical protein CRH01_26310 [Chryseobacterium rhizosphaerae]